MPERRGPEHWVRPEIRALRAYHVQPAAGLIKLDAMENPWPLPSELVEPWLDCLRGAELNRYPDASAATLQAALREAMAVPDGAQLLLGNGSDELIQIIASAVAAPGRCLLAPEPGFVMYRMIATFCGLDYVGVPLQADFELDLPAMLAQIEARQPAVIFLAWPNNPTGNLFAREQVEAVIEVAPGLVVVDEAYHAFAGTSFMGELGRWPNLLVMRTLSKMGLAGLRLGLLAGPARWIDEFDKLRLPYNINTLTQLSATFAMRHGAAFAEQTEALRSERERLAGALALLPGLTVFPSAANFLLLRVPAGQASAWFGALREGGILIKNLDGSHPLLHDCLRITVGTPEENHRLLEALTALA